MREVKRTLALGFDLGLLMNPLEVLATPSASPLSPAEQTTRQGVIQRALEPPTEPAQQPPINDSLRGCTPEVASPFGHSVFSKSRRRDVKRNDSSTPSMGRHEH